MADDTVKRLWHTSAHLRTMEEADIREAIEDAADEIERLLHNLTQLRSDNRRLADLYEGLYYATEQARRG